jgi:hypothetical protein
VLEADMNSIPKYELKDLISVFSDFRESLKKKDPKIEAEVAFYFSNKK